MLRARARDELGLGRARHPDDAGPEVRGELRGVHAHPSPGSEHQDRATRPDPQAPPDAASARERYVEFLLTRLAAADRWLP